MTLFCADLSNSKAYSIGGYAKIKIGTLPEEYRPRKNYQFYTQVRNSSLALVYLIAVLVYSNGDVYLYNANSNQTISFDEKGFCFGWDV